ncbi:MAG: hypothetical protein V3V52_10415 [Candidatus Adiutricales bacterium]
MKILALGSGPDRIGKTGELDRFAVQGLDYLMEQSHEVVWIDSNPATLASSKALGCRVYIEPMNIEVLKKVLDLERPEAVMHTFGGYLAQHLLIFLERDGVLDRLEVKVLGTSIRNLKRSLDEEVLKNILGDLSLPVTKAIVARTHEECVQLSESLGFPLVMRPAFALEGMGGYLLFNLEEVRQMAGLVLNLSPVREVVLENLPLDWTQIALECVHDVHNSDGLPFYGTLESLNGRVGVHMGNSLVVSPAPSFKGEVLARALEWARDLSAEMRISGSFQIRFAFSKEKNELIVLRITQGINRFSSMLAVPRRLPLGRISAALALGLSIDEYMADHKNDSSTCTARLPVFPDQWPSLGVMNPSMSATGARLLMGEDPRQCLSKVLEVVKAAETPSQKKAAPNGVQDREHDPFSLVNTIDCIVQAMGEQTEVKQVEKSGQIISEASAEANKTDLLSKQISRPQRPPRKAEQTDLQTLLIMGPGPYRIGWGAELDSSLVQTAQAWNELGLKTILINDNPDAVSLEFAVMDDIFLESPTLEVIEAVLDKWPVTGVTHQFCPDLPAGLEQLLTERGIEVLGTPLSSRESLQNTALLWKTLKAIGVPLISHALSQDLVSASEQAQKLGYPILVRLTDRVINPKGDTLYEPDELRDFFGDHGQHISEDYPLFIEKFTDGLVGAQVLAVADGQDVLILEFLENIEEYGIHGADCASINTALSIGELPKAFAEDSLRLIASHSHMVGHLKLDLAIAGRHCYVTGVWPYPSQNIALAEKSLSGDIHGLTARLLLGGKVTDVRPEIFAQARKYLVKESVFPFHRFPGLDPILSPQSSSTGQVLGCDDSIGKAYYKSQVAVNPEMPTEGNVFLSARDTEKESILQVAWKLLGLGFSILSTQGTAKFLTRRGINVTSVHKVSERRPNVFDLIKNGGICMVINISGGRQSKLDDQMIRRAALEQNIPLITTISGAFLMVNGMGEIQKSPLSLQFSENG